MSVARKYPDAGARPTLRWIGKMHLRIDARYQRDVSTKRGQALVRKIAAEWRWAHCLPLVVTDNFDGTFNVIDGQHRLFAADARPDIAELPCYVIPTETLQDEAQAFVAYNRDRVQLTPLAVYHALVAARDAGAQVIADACKAARVVVLKQPKMLDECAFNEAQCIGALRAVVRAWGGDHLARTLKILTAAWPDGEGGLRAPLVHAVAALLEAAPDVADAAIAAILAERAPDDWHDRAVAARHDFNGRSRLALVDALQKRLRKKAA